MVALDELDGNGNIVARESTGIAFIPLIGIGGRF
jgi:hypothetical protein